jgi:RNA polymerase sigma-70 factor, ECF subfamily
MLEPVTESVTPDTAGPRCQRSIEQVPSATVPSATVLSATALPDLLLVERARSKEMRAFETLMRRYNRRLFRIARSIVPDMEVAETVVQEAFLLAFSDIERYEPTGKFGAWLARLAFNQALALRRSARPGAAAPVAEPVTAALPANGNGSEAAGQIDEVPSRQLLEQAIDGLPEVFRTVFVLRAVEGISGIETAACLGINETTVRTRLYRAQRRLDVDLSRRVSTERGEIFELTDGRADYIVNRVLARMNGASRSQEA